jgi:membrane-bound lytic murein transglycosylase MltF
MIQGKYIRVYDSTVNLFIHQFQSYQESHWNAGARSHTGVRGLMMLTQTTAKAMGIKKRTDPRQSIKGGAKYLNHMLKRVPEDVVAEDRIWFAPDNNVSDQYI